MHDSGTRGSLVCRYLRGVMGCLFLGLLALMTSGCATTAVPDPEPTLSTVGRARSSQMLRAEIQSWLGTPHRMGGLSRRGIDCSGLVVVLYDDLFDMQLPRTTTALMRRGRRVEKHNLTAGDLVFFKPAEEISPCGDLSGPR
jgi:probable lipoprotein NlpC